MQRNSFIDCSRIKKYKTEDVLEQLVNNSDWILGEIDEVVRGNICDALTNSPLVTPFDRKTCIKSLIR